MKIVDIETFIVNAEWQFLAVHTDADITGWGEASLRGRAHSVAAAVADIGGALIGGDPLRIEHHWQRLAKREFHRAGAVLSCAVSAIDQALWDIAGKAKEAPVYELLGGHVRDRARVYAWVEGDGAEEAAESAARWVAEGFRAVKMQAAQQLRIVDSPSRTSAIVRRLEAVREVIGPDRDLMIDFHGRVSTPMARRLLPLLVDIEPLFVEEPILPEHGRHFEALVRGSSVPIATGERLYSRGEFLDVLAAGVAVAQPDLSYAGGISEVRRIASLAETFDAALAPHCPLGPIAFAASLQIAFASPNFLVQEQYLGIDSSGTWPFLDLLSDRTPFRYVDGYIHRPCGPGLGLDVDEGAVRDAAKWAASRPLAAMPVWHHDDGSYAPY